MNFLFYFDILGIIDHRNIMHHTVPGTVALPRPGTLLNFLSEPHAVATVIQRISTILVLYYGTTVQCTTRTVV